MAGQKQPKKPAAIAASPATGSRGLTAVICVVLAALTLAVFGQLVNAGFVNCDDPTYVYENPMVNKGLTAKGVAWAFTTFHAENWHPLTWLSHMLDCQIYGIKPGGHHLTNVLIHTATVVLLFLVLRQLTGALMRSAFVAAVLAIHPLRVESVAWVAERKDVLSGLFFVLTIGAYTRYTRLPWSPRRYGLVMLLFALGLMCKPMPVTLPVILLLLDFWPLQRQKPARELILEKLPLFAVSAASCWITILAQHGAIQSADVVSLPLRLESAVVAIAIYLRQMFWPTNLALIYPFPQQGIPTSQVAVAAILIVGLSAVAWWQRRMRPWLLTGWLWYLVMLLPVLGIIQVGAQAHADRYTYLPEIGIGVILAWQGAQWVEARLPRPILAILMASFIIVLSACAWMQAGFWKDPETLWNRSLACTSGNYLAHLNLGTILLNEGKIDDAIVQYQDALQINPRYRDATFNLGVAYMRQGKINEAIAQYQAALQIQPNDAVANVALGILFAQSGKWSDAAEHLQGAAELDPGNVRYKNDLAWLVATCPDRSVRNGAKAVEVGRQAVALSGGSDPVVLHALAAALAEAGQFPEAIATAQRALQLAGMQSDAKLTDRLKTELELYQAGIPYHEPTRP